jgi:hypothetical protein
MTDEKVLICVGLGAAGILALIMVANSWGTPEAAGQSDGGFDVEEKIGARVPFYSRNGHYAEFGIGNLPIYWEKHRLCYPRTPSPLLSGLLCGDMSMRRPHLDADKMAWFAEPPAEQIMSSESYT